jgi:hypothetical protein
MADGAAAMLLASPAAVARHGLVPLARVLGMASAGVPPRIMGIGPVPAVGKLLGRLRMKVSDLASSSARSHQDDDNAGFAPRRVMPSIVDRAPCTATFW